MLLSYKEGPNGSLEIGAIAQVLGAIAILLSLIFVIIELRKNLKQNNIANTLQRR